MILATFPESCPQGEQTQAVVCSYHSLVFSPEVVTFRFRDNSFVPDHWWQPRLDPSTLAGHLLCRCTALPQLYIWLLSSSSSLNPSASPGCIPTLWKANVFNKFIVLLKETKTVITHGDATSGPQNGIKSDIFCIYLSASMLSHCVFVCGFLDCSHSVWGATDLNTIPTH